MIRYPSKVKTNNLEESEKLASDFMSICKRGDRVILNGELGSGKTFFVKSALSTMGIIEVNSPSFAIVNEYFKDFHIYHFDFYRLKNSMELFDIGWQDYLNDDESIIFIEWGIRFRSILPSECIEINIEIIGETEREFRFDKYS